MKKYVENFTDNEFLPRDDVRSAVLAVGRRPSVCHSVRTSVTFVYPNSYRYRQTFSSW